MKHSRHGYTLIEIIVVIAIIAFLSMISIPNFMRFLARAKRSEAYLNLGALYTHEKAYWAEHSTYTTNLGGPGGAGWRPEGYSGGGAQERFYYTYGFTSGKEGEGLFTGKLGAPASALGNTSAGAQAFIAAAAADIDGDGQYDLLTVNEHNEIKLVQDDVA